MARRKASADLDASQGAVEAPPLVEVGAELSLCLAKQGAAEDVRVVRIKKAKMAKGDRGWWIYTVRRADGFERKTRLAHLSWRRSAEARPDGRIRTGGTASEYLQLLRSAKTTKIVAPMVGGSELAFRLLCRRYGADVAYTPMMHSGEFARDASYRRRWLQSTGADWPLVAHFCGNDPEVIGQACRLAVDECASVDAVDLNLGCPQRVAYSGHFGSYLLGDEDRPLVKRLIAAMRAAVPARVAVCCKIRLLDSPESTLLLATDVRDAGADVVAIHGRKRATWHKRGPGARDGPADLAAVRAIVEGLGDTICVVSNGNVRTRREAALAADSTRAGGVMSAEALLNNPTLFADEDDAPPRPQPARQLRVAREYLDLVRTHGNPAGYRSVAFHVRRIAAEVLERYDALDDLLDGESLDDAVAVVDRCRGFATGRTVFVQDPGAKERAADRKRKRDDAKKARCRFEERMARKAKRAGKPLDFYLKIGADPPTPAQLDDIRALPDDKARLEQWKTHFGQVCFNFLLHPSGCARGDTCAFLHAAVKSPDLDDLVSG